MTSTFFGLNTAMRALMAQQQALDVTNHNMANANTPGFSRQVVSFVTTPPYTVAAFNRSASAGQVGTGVEVSLISRTRNIFVDQQIRSEETELGRYSVRRDSLNQVQTIINEPSDVGLSTILSQFFTGWRELSNDPQNTAARATLRQQAGNLISTLHRDYQELTQIRADMNKQVQVKVDDINSKASQIAALNAQISAVQAVGDQANDLRDKRDVLLDDLSSVVRVSYNEMSNGSVSVFLDGHALVDGAGTNTVGTALNANGDDILVWPDSGSPINVISGEIKGYYEARDDVLTKEINQLQDLTSALITQVNTIHRAGYGLNGTTGVDFFTGTGADDIAISADIQGNLASIAAASAIDSPGDGRNALAIAGLQDTAVTIGTSNTTIGEFYKSMVSELGVEINGASNLADNQDVLVQYLQRQRDSYSGVSTDEEATNLIKFQRAYQAAARIVTTFDETLNTIINNMGLVGR
ncbi:MAG: flagellar hook-associated protein FlgK [Chloroflexi bacterium]|nr:flagellar hook-associated protein FlgK [Chloroflexota bacterium]